MVRFFSVCVFLFYTQIKPKMIYQVTYPGRGSEAESFFFFHLEQKQRFSKKETNQYSARPGLEVHFVSFFMTLYYCNGKVLTALSCVVSQ